MTEKKETKKEQVDRDDRLLNEIGIIFREVEDVESCLIILIKAVLRFIAMNPSLDKEAGLSLYLDLTRHAHELLNEYYLEPELEAKGNKK